mmetsp:Transcript_17249/g.52450  ORF Transcript_17249/g.52450 Transcript_17249/m.52450 type:complete len:287 (+) Transcript_17249:766-1626(+)
MLRTRDLRHNFKPKSIARRGDSGRETAAKRPALRCALCKKRSLEHRTCLLRGPRLPHANLRTASRKTTTAPQQQQQQQQRKRQLKQQHRKKTKKRMQKRTTERSLAAGRGCCRRTHDSQRSFKPKNFARRDDSGRETTANGARTRLLCALSRRRRRSRLRPLRCMQTKKTHRRQTCRSLTCRSRSRQRRGAGRRVNRRRRHQRRNNWRHRCMSSSATTCLHLPSRRLRHLLSQRRHRSGRSRYMRCSRRSRTRRHKKLRCQRWTLRVTAATRRRKRSTTTRRLTVP